MDKQTTKLIIETTCSESLKKTIKKSKFEISDFDLLILLYRHAPDFKTRLDLLRKIEKDTQDIRTREHAARCIAFEEGQFAKFTASAEHCIFEVKITSSPDAYEESFLAETYEGALNKVENFCKNYDVKLDVNSRFTIAKRRVTDDVDEKALDEDTIAEGSYKAGSTLMTMWHKDFERGQIDDDADCDEECMGCQSRKFTCAVPKLPQFINNMDIVSYDDYHCVKQYSIVFEMANPAARVEDECAYCININAGKILSSKIKTKEEFFSGLMFGLHEHTEYPKIDVIRVQDLPVEIRKAYKVFMRLYKRFNEVNN